MPTWLVVEDEEDIQDVILAMFEIWGVSGKSFSDGLQAVKWLRSLQPNTLLPELALIDIRLPSVSGIKVAAAMRCNPYLGAIPIVLITAYRLSESEESHVMIESQADMLLYKPLPPMAELRQLFNMLIVHQP